MADTDVAKQRQPADAPSLVRWFGWFVEKVGVPAAIIFALIFSLGAKMDTMNQNIVKLITVVEQKK